MGRRKKSALEKQLEASIRAIKAGELPKRSLADRLRARDNLDMPDSLEDPLDYPPDEKSPLYDDE